MKNTQEEEGKGSDNQSDYDDEMDDMGEMGGSVSRQPPLGSSGGTKNMMPPPSSK
jgi:hypothetical protein